MAWKQNLLIITSILIPSFAGLFIARQGWISEELISFFLSSFLIALGFIYFSIIVFKKNKYPDQVTNRLLIQGILKSIAMTALGIFGIYWNL